MWPSHYKEWNRFNEVFNFLSISVLINEQIFCVHEGISFHLTNFQELKDIQKSITTNCFDEQRITFNDIKENILSDPEIEYGKIENQREIISFGQNLLKEFSTKFNLKMIYRGHQIAKDGIEFPFFPNKSFLTIFSEQRYKLYGDNKVAIAHIDQKLNFTISSFEHLEPNLYSETNAKCKKQHVS